MCEVFVDDHDVAFTILPEAVFERFPGFREWDEEVMMKE